MTRSALLTLALLALCACTAAAPSGRVVDLLGRAAHARMVTSPGTETTHEAYRIDGMAHMEGRAADGAERLHGYPVLAGPVPVDTAGIAELRDVLIRDDTYLWDVAKACEFLPGVLVRYREPGATLDVLLCFSCDELEVFADGKKAGHEDFDPRRADLVRIVKRLFPDDPQIGALR